MATAEEIATAFVPDGHKYGWRFAKIWGRNNPNGNPAGWVVVISQLKFKAEIDGKTYTLNCNGCYWPTSESSGSLLPTGNGDRAGSRQLLFSLYYDPDNPEAPARLASSMIVSTNTTLYPLEENEFLVRMTVSTKSASLAEFSIVNAQCPAFMFETDRSGANFASIDCSRWWIRQGSLDDDGWDFCFEFSQDKSPKITGFSVCIENLVPDAIPQETDYISAANGMYLYMDDRAELQTGGGIGNKQLAHWLDPASIKTIAEASPLPQLELRYKHPDGTIYELKGGTEVDTSNLVTLDGKQTISGAKTFGEPVTLSAEGTAGNHAVSKAYVDSKVASGSQEALTGVAKLDATQTFTGANTFSGATNFTAAVTAKDPVNATELATKQYVDAKAAEVGGAQDNLVTLDGAQTITGVKTFSAAPVISVAPSEANHAATKAYVDTLAVTGSNPNIYTLPQTLTLSATITGHNRRHFLNEIRIYTKENLRITFKYVPSVCTGTKTFIGVVDGVGSGRAEAQEDTFFKTYELQPGEFKGSMTFYPDVNGANAGLASLGIELFGYEDSLCIHAIPPSGGSSSYKENVGLVRFDFEAPAIDRVSIVLSGDRREPADMAAPTQLSGVKDATISYGYGGSDGGYTFPDATYITASQTSNVPVVYRPGENDGSKFTPRFPIYPLNYIDGTLNVLKPKVTYYGVNGANKWYYAPIALRNLRVETTAGPLYLKYYQTTLSFVPYSSDTLAGSYIVSLDPCTPVGKPESFFEEYTLGKREAKCTFNRLLSAVDSGSNLGQLFFNSTDSEPCVLRLRTSIGSSDDPATKIKQLDFPLIDGTAALNLGVEALSISVEIVHDADHPEWDPQEGYRIIPMFGSQSLNSSSLPSDFVSDPNGADLYAKDMESRWSTMGIYPPDATQVTTDIAMGEAYQRYGDKKGYTIQDVPSSAVVSTFSPQNIGGQKTFCFPPRSLLLPQVDTDCCNKAYVDSKIAELAARVAALEGAGA